MKLTEFYYDKRYPLWKGQEAINLLTSHLEIEGKTSKSAKTATQKFLAKQAIFRYISHLPSKSSTRTIRFTSKKARDGRSRDNAS